MSKDLEARLAAMEAALAAANARNAELEAKANTPQVITYKVSEKGALSAYGLGKWPFTFYLSQIERFDGDIANRQAFIKANRAKFATKTKA